MSTLLEAMRGGFYAQKQINSRSRLIAWSHRGRFATGLRLAREGTLVISVPIETGIPVARKRAAGSDSGRADALASAEAEASALRTRDANRERVA